MTVSPLTFKTDGGAAARFDVPPVEEPPEFDRWPRPVATDPARASSLIGLRWHGDADPDADRAWLIRDLISETGKGLASGQWGSGKAFGVLDLSACVMTGEPFAGRKVMRRGGVLFIASEGAYEIPIRLRGIVQGKLGASAGEHLPFAWVEECPRLLDADAVPKLVVTAKVAAEHLARAFSMISGSRKMLYPFVVSHFLHASRRPRRWKML